MYSVKFGVFLNILRLYCPIKNKFSGGNQPSRYNDHVEKERRSAEKDVYRQRYGAKKYKLKCLLESKDGISIADWPTVRVRFVLRSKRQLFVQSRSIYRGVTS